MRGSSIFSCVIKMVSDFVMRFIIIVTAKSFFAYMVFFCLYCIFFLLYLMVSFLFFLHCSLFLLHDLVNPNKSFSYNFCLHNNQFYFRCIKRTICKQWITRSYMFICFWSLMIFQDYVSVVFKATILKQHKS